jgi:hypothetical protein
MHGGPPMRGGAPTRGGPRMRGVPPMRGTPGAYDLRGSHRGQGFTSRGRGGYVAIRGEIPKPAWMKDPAVAARAAIAVDSGNSDDGNGSSGHRDPGLGDFVSITHSLQNGYPPEHPRHPHDVPLNMVELQGNVDDVYTTRGQPQEFAPQPARGASPELDVPQDEIPEEWVRVLAPNNIPYWYSTKTSETTWNNPSETRPPADLHGHGGSGADSALADGAAYGIRGRNDDNTGQKRPHEPNGSESERDRGRRRIDDDHQHLSDDHFLVARENGNATPGDARQLLDGFAARRRANEDARLDNPRR